MKKLLALYALMLALAGIATLAVYGSVVYVIAHFVRKVW